MVEGGGGGHKHKIMDEPFKPKYGTVSQVLLQLLLETYSIRFFMGNRKVQFAIKLLQFHVPEISNFSKVFSSVQFIFI